ncbi:MAG: hypothetical protein CBB68_14065 [Rhodospirillaceae bacterium TMED8]|nr:hypothetical protein [Magnetovibrio sp.]OUT48087.1 MAG: hypothetical protein CBB68_14065 [Rhodospirillaceae bacterium TMED8]
MKIKAINGALGIEVCNLDLNNITSLAKSDLLDLYNEHIVLVFRDQNLTPDNHRIFSEIFGPVYAHPLKTRASVQDVPEVLILENKPGRPGAPNNYWHSDISHADQPPSATTLHALTVPQGYGDTMICSMVRAYESLSDCMREMLRDQKALHSGIATFKRSIGGNSDARLIDSSEIKPPRAHPIVRNPKGTNQRALFVNPHFTIGVEDMTVEEGTWMLNHLYHIATKPENIYRHQWCIGDVLVWDNRRSMHYAVRDYTEEMPRKLHRCTSRGEIPA